MKKRLSGIYAITDERLTPDSTILAQVASALQGGASIIQFRDKSRSDADVKELCMALQRICKKFEALFVIDDRVDLACEIGADGLHIGKDDGSVALARERFVDGILGVSCYGSVAKAKEAQEAGADYVAFGSFFASPTKPHSGIVNMSVLTKAKEQLQVPICAIGGINHENISQIVAHEPDMIAVVSAVFDGDVLQNTKELVAKMEKR